MIGHLQHDVQCMANEPFQKNITTASRLNGIAVQDSCNGYLISMRTVLLVPDTLNLAFFHLGGPNLARVLLEKA